MRVRFALRGETCVSDSYRAGETCASDSYWKGGGNRVVPRGEERARARLDVEQEALQQRAARASPRGVPLGPARATLMNARGSALFSSRTADRQRSRAASPARGDAMHPSTHAHQVRRAARSRDTRRVAHAMHAPPRTGGQQKRTCAPPAIFLDMMDATISGSDDVVPAHARSRGAGGLTFHRLNAGTCQRCRGRGRAGRRAGVACACQ